MPQERVPTLGPDGKLLEQFLPDRVGEAGLDERYASTIRAGASLVNSDTSRRVNYVETDALPAGWRDESNGDGALAYGEDSALPGTGGRIMGIQANAGSNGVASSDFFPVIPGVSYKVSADMWKAGANPTSVFLRIVWANSGYGYLGYTDAWASGGLAFSDHTTTPPPLSITSFEAVPPAGSAFAYMQVINSLPPSDSYLLVANPRVDRVEVASLPDRLAGNITGTARHLDALGNDWNLATSTGWYMSDAATNAPGAGWYIGEVVAHNSDWVTQEVWAFTSGDPSSARWRRHRRAGTWDPWKYITDTKPTAWYSGGDYAADLNTSDIALNQRTWWCDNSSSNLPAAGSWIGQTIQFNGAGGYRTQILTDANTNNGVARTYVRHQVAGGWQAWRIVGDERFGRFGDAQSNVVTNPDLALKPGSYDWGANTATSPNKFFALADDWGANLVVTSYQDDWVKQTARIWNSDQTWVRFRHGGLDIWGEWVPVHTHKAIDSTRQRMAHKGGSGRNLVYNGRFDYVTDPTQQIHRSISRLKYNVPGWQQSYNGEPLHSDGTWTFGGSGANGGLSLGLRATNNTVGIWATSDPFPISPGKTYRWKFRVYSDTAIPQGIFMSVDWRRRAAEYANYSDQLISSNDLVGNAGHVGATFVTYEGYITAPADPSTQVACLRPHAWVGSNPNGTNTVYYTDIEFEEVIPTAALGDSGWITLSSFSNGWVNFGSGWAGASYRKIGNRVFLRGLIAAGTISGDPNTNTAFTLPVGYRPIQSNGTMHAVVSNDAFGQVRAAQDGRVGVFTGSSTWVNLDGISFFTD